MAVRVLLCLCVLVGVSLAATPCNPQDYQNINPAPALPQFTAKEFTADVEMANINEGMVIQIRLIYSESKNHIKMAVLSEGKRTDIYYIGNEGKGEVLRIDYSQGRGSCLVSSFADEVNEAMFFVGGGIRKHDINTPLRMLRLSGPSGYTNFPDIKLKKIADSTVRGMDADGWESCQKWTTPYGDSLDLKVEHYFTKPGNPWKYPSSQFQKTSPLMIRVKGAGTYGGQAIDSFQHIYSFFRFRPYVDARELETPAGVYCSGRQKVSFPQVPTAIQFTAEVVDNINGQYYSMEEIFDTTNQYAIIKQRGLTTFREYSSGLNFQIQDNQETCSVLNITDKNSGKLPFDFQADGGISKQLSADQFFYKGTNTYEYVGGRSVRGIHTEAFITRAPLLSAPDFIATIEWYFAYHDLVSWNDNVADYSQKKLRMPILMRVWTDDSTSRSIDINFFEVDFSRMLFGYINLRPCFPDTASNHFQLILPDVQESDITHNMEDFKWFAVFDLAKVTGLQWWRIVDFQFFMNNGGGATIEFEMLDPPRISSDVLPPPVYVTVKEARARLLEGLNNNFQIKVWDETQLFPSKGVKTEAGTITIAL